MTDAELEKMDLAGLKALQKKVANAIEGYEARQKKEALEAIAETAKKHGFSLDDLIGGRKKIKVPAPAKYRHPENPGLTWSGRGRQPAWFKELVEAGKNPEDFAVKT